MEEAGECAEELTLVVAPGQVRVAGERDEACVRQERCELAAAPDRNGAVTTAMQHERRHRDARQ